MTLTKDEKAAFYDFICKYATEIEKHNDEFHLENQDVQTCLNENDIYIVEGLGKNKTKAKKHLQYVVWKKNQKKTDHAYEVLTHVRNSLAHARLEKKDGFYLLNDYSGKQHTMEGKIKIDILNNLMELLSNSRTSNE